MAARGTFAPFNINSGSHHTAIAQNSLPPTEVSFSLMRHQIIPVCLCVWLFVCLAVCLRVSVRPSVRPSLFHIACSFAFAVIWPNCLVDITIMFSNWCMMTRGMADEISRHPEGRGPWTGVTARRNQPPPKCRMSADQTNRHEVSHGAPTIASNVISAQRSVKNYCAAKLLQQYIKPYPGRLSLCSRGCNWTTPSLYLVSQQASIFCLSIVLGLKLKA